MCLRWGEEETEGDDIACSQSEKPRVSTPRRPSEIDRTKTKQTDPEGRGDRTTNVPMMPTTLRAASGEIILGRWGVVAARGLMRCASCGGSWNGLGRG